MNDTRFRPDIQGLRALSIISVVLFHAGASGFSGGFVGVDVFFVISGFLIGGLLVDEMSTTGTINLKVFFGRRIRRLLPNATATIIFTLLLVTWLLPAHVREKIGGDSIASSLFYINFRLSANVVNYFQNDDTISPFLHFWSLAIEEQFYFFFPLLILIIFYFFNWSLRTALALVATIFLVSFALNIFVVTENQPAAFFRSDTRCWQLAAGVLVALGLRLYGPIPSYLRVIGLLLVVGSVVLMADDRGYPGFWALLPTLGSVFIVWSAPFEKTSTLGRIDLLSSYAMQWLGARSYSWYLWHWPIMVFTTTSLGSSFLTSTSAVLGSLLIAHLMFTTIEEPVRRGTWLNIRSAWVFGAGALCILTSVGASILYMNIPWNPRVEKWTELVRKSTEDFPPSFLDKCHLTEDTEVQEECIYGDKTGKKLVLLFGDSHASQWLAAIDSAAASKGWRVNSWTKTGCPSIAVSMWFLPRNAYYRNCDVWRERNIANLKGPQKPDLVIIANRIDYSGWIFDKKSQEVLNGAEADNAWAAGLDATLSELAKLNVPIVVIRDTPTAYMSFRDCLMAGGESKCDRPRVEATGKSTSDAAVTFSHSRKNKLITLLDMTDAICDKRVCPMMKDGVVVFQDPDHLTATFSRSLASHFVPLFP